MILTLAYLKYAKVRILKAFVSPRQAHLRRKTLEPPGYSAPLLNSPRACEAANAQPPEPGIFHLARWFPGVDIVPVWIANSHRILPKGLALPLPLLCSITFGAPLRWKEGQQQQEFLAEVRAALEALRPG